MQVARRNVAFARHNVFYMSKTELILAVDIGGTKIAAGLVTLGGEILSTLRTPMVAKKSAAEGFAAVRNATEQVLRGGQSGKIRAIGVSVPGWVDSRTGALISAANLPCWRNFPLAQEIETQFHLPVRVANDAKAAALAEAAWGAGRGHRNVFYATLGTGVGTGLVIDGRIYSGRRGPAGEGGHITIDFHGPRCGCGKFGCAEMYISGPAIARNAQQRLRKKSAKRSLLLKLAGGKIADVKAEHVVSAADSGDALAKEVLAEIAERLAIWLGNIIDLLEPEIIVIGGGLSGVVMNMLPEIRKHLKHWASSPGNERTPIAKAFYGAESSLAGAAALHFNISKTKTR
jgi:glucokinase